MPLSWLSGNSKGYPNNINTYDSMCQVASGQYDSNYIDAFTNLAALSYGGYSDFVRRGIVGMAHETNGAWYSTYAGIDTTMIGLNTLKNSSDAVWGAEVATLRRQCAIDGNRGPLLKYSYERMVDIARSIDPDWVFLWTWTNAAANPDGIGGGANDLNYTSLPDRNGNYVNLFGMDLYCRGSGRPPYTGGPVEDETSWDLSSLETILQVALDLSGEFNCPMAFGEVNGMFDEPGTIGSTVTCTDDEGYIWLKHFYTWINSNRLGMWAHWNAQGDKPDNTTYFPDPDMYPRVTELMETWFPKPDGGGWPI